MMSINDLPVTRIILYECNICKVHYQYSNDMKKHCKIMHNAKVITS